PVRDAVVAARPRPRRPGRRRRLGVPGTPPPPGLAGRGDCRTRRLRFRHPADVRGVRTSGPDLHVRSVGQRGPATAHRRTPGPGGGSLPAATASGPPSGATAPGPAESTLYGLVVSGRDLGSTALCGGQGRSQRP